MGEQLLTFEDAAEKAKIGRTMMFAVVKSGEIESVKIGRLRRIPESALDRWIARMLDEQGGEAA